MAMDTELNAEELMHLALHATEHESPDKAISYLKRLLKVDPDNGKAYYLMGALHAEIGMHKQAMDEMTKALELDSSLPETARFQLGLLYITSGNIPEAEATWQPLDQLGNEHALYLFKTGMLHLVRDEFDQCAETLRKGIEVNSFNEDLNNDMRRVLQDAENAAGHPHMTKQDNLNSKGGDGQRMLLSIYEREDDKNS